MSLKSVVYTALMNMPFKKKHDRWGHIMRNVAKINYIGNISRESPSNIYRKDNYQVLRLET